MPLGLACPQCDKLGVENELFQPRGMREIQCAAGHKYGEPSEVQEAGARSIGRRPPVTAFRGPSENLRLPAPLVAALRGRFGEMTETTAASFLEGIAQPGAFLVSMSDSEELERAVGRKIESSRALLGICREWSQRITDAEGRAQQAQAAPASDARFDEVMRQIEALKSQVGGGPR